MNTRAASSIGLLTAGLFAIGVLIGFIFMYAGSQAGNVFYLRNDLYAKDVALLTNSLLSLPTDSDVILQYPHDFQSYSLQYGLNEVAISYTAGEKEKSQSIQAFLGNQNYEFNLQPQDSQLRINKLGNKTINGGGDELRKERN